MTNKQHLGTLIVLIAAGLAGCESSRSPVPGPSPIQQPAPPQPPQTPTLRVFTEAASGFSTSDVRDAQGQIVQFNSAHELIWTDDGGTRLPGFRVEQGIYIPCEPCEGWIEVRFGTEDGERRAYLTVDYGHDNPGTLVDMEVVGRTLTVSRTNVYPPGSYTLSGLVTEMTSAGEVPIEGAAVYRGYGSGWQSGTTDANGVYQIRGLYDRTDIVSVIKEGYRTQEKTLTVSGDTRFDLQLVRLADASRDK
jgi:hypothetical protein